MFSLLINKTATQSPGSSVYYLKPILCSMQMLCHAKQESEEHITYLLDMP